MRSHRAAAYLAGVSGLLASQGCSQHTESAAPQFRVVRELAHDPSAYTQGLVLEGNVFYESTGLYGHSELRRVDVASGRVLQSVRLPDDRFGEGLALLNSRLYQITWQSGVAYVYDKASFALLDSIKYPGEGWGLATDGTSLIMSDGSDSLRIMTPDFKVTRTVHVRYNNAPLQQLNELEFVDGDVFANVYQSDWIVQIDLKTGNVKQLLDFSDLYPDRPQSAEVLNGIAASSNGSAARRNRIPKARTARNSFTQPMNICSAN